MAWYVINTGTTLHMEIQFENSKKTTWDAYTSVR
jgi:hypothetical protein